MPTLADRMRTKLETLRNRITARGAQFESRAFTTRVAWYDPVQGYRKTKSSWIRSYAYDKYSRVLYMTTHTGKTYSWANVPPDLAAKIEMGLAACRTTDPTGKRRWIAGKYPSLGAAYWQYLEPYKASSPTRVPIDIGQALAANAIEPGIISLWE